MVVDKMVGIKRLGLKRYRVYTLPPFIIRIVFGLVVLKQGVKR